MSISDVSIIQTRIKAATPKSPIAVFKLPIRQNGFLEAVFGSTFRTQRFVRQDDPLFVGYFHREMDPDAVYGLLHVAAHS